MLTIGGLSNESSGTSKSGNPFAYVFLSSNEADTAGQAPDSNGTRLNYGPLGSSFALAELLGCWGGTTGTALPSKVLRPRANPSLRRRGYVPAGARALAVIAEGTLGLRGDAGVGSISPGLSAVSRRPDETLRRAREANFLSLTRTVEPAQETQAGLTSVGT